MSTFYLYINFLYITKFELLKYINLVISVMVLLLKTSRIRITLLVSSHRNFHVKFVINHN